MTLPRTPYYLIDERRLQHNLEIIERVRERSGAKSVLALKCFSTWGVFDLMRRYLDGTTSSSPYEAMLGRQRFGKEVHAYSVAYSEDDVLAVRGIADKVIFNSAGQLRRFAHLVEGSSLGVRVNPGVSFSHFDLADPARKHSRLGVTDDAELRDIAPLLDGVMFHFNCENEDVESLASAIERIGERFGWLLGDVSWVSLGGGISFTSDAYPLDRFIDLLAGLRDRFGVQVYLEPGEAAITKSAELVTTVLDIVRNDAEIVVVDASLEAHMLDHLIYGTRPLVSSPAAGEHDVTIAGRTCLAGDEFGEHRLAAPLRVGDEVRFADAAGYTMVKTTWFNGLRMPSIVVRRLDGSVEVVREFGYSDFEATLS